jgi:hypothetical protein
VRVGDVLRATSAAMMRMTYPTTQLLLGGARCTQDNPGNA